MNKVDQVQVNLFHRWLQIYSALLVFRALLLIGSYLYFKNSLISADFVWFWVIWGLIDYPLTLIYYIVQYYFDFFALFNGLGFELFLLLLHLVVGTFFWSILGFIIYLLVRKIWEILAKVVS